jgi:hypothetical protein
VYIDFILSGILPLILQGGMRMSTQGQGDGGVYFSLRSPLSYNLGNDDYEVNIIKDCFGVERVNEYVGKGKLDALIVYGCEPQMLAQAPGGRDNAKMVPKSYFHSLMLPKDDGTYFLRPDRILAVFVINGNIVRWREKCIETEYNRLLKIEKDYSIFLSNASLNVDAYTKTMLEVSIKTEVQTTAAIDTTGEDDLEDGGSESLSLSDVYVHRSDMQDDSIGMLLSEQTIGGRRLSDNPLFKGRVSSVSDDDDIHYSGSPPLFVKPPKNKSEIEMEDFSTRV